MVRRIISVNAAIAVDREQNQRLHGGDAFQASASGAICAIRKVNCAFSYRDLTAAFRAISMEGV